MTRLACELEGNTGAEEHAYKLALLFGNYDDAVSWLSEETDPIRGLSRQPIHDSLLFTLPDSNDWEPRLWKELLERNGKGVFRYLPRARALEQYWKEIDGEKLAGLSFGQLKIHDLAVLASKIQYEEWGEHPSFATFCAKIVPKVTERGFRLGLSALQQLAKSPEVIAEDRIPDVGIIDGESFGCPGYYLRKLQKSDESDMMLALTIGRFAHCCNHIDGATSTMAVAQVTSPYGGVYAIFPKLGGLIDPAAMPVAKTTVWLGTGRGKGKGTDKGREGLVFNQFNSRLTDANLDFEQLLVEAAKRALVVDPKLSAVHLGGSHFGGGRVESLLPVDPKTRSSDSSVQALVFSDTMLSKDERKQIAKELSVPNKKPVEFGDASQSTLGRILSLKGELDLPLIGTSSAA